MHLRYRARSLLLASWETDAEHVARALPPGLRPATVDGRHLVTIAALRWTGVRLGRMPLPPFSQLNVRAYARRESEPDGETGVCFLTIRTTLPGMGGALLGVPVRPASIRVREGLVEAGGLGVRIPYERRGPAGPSELAEHELGLFEAAGVRALRVVRGPAAWERAEVTGPVEAEPLLALGFAAGGPPELLYADTAPFEVELPAR